MIMESKEGILQELGLSKNDARVYTTLLQESANTISAIAKRSGIHRANVYDAMSRLKSKGLLAESTKNGKKAFKAANPASLINLLHEKELKLNEVLPQFKLDYHMSENSNMVEVYEGAAAIRNVFQHCVEIKEDIYAFGLPKNIIHLIGEHFQNAIHKKRAKQKQWMYHIYNSDATKRMKFLNTLPYTKARALSPAFDCPVTTVVCGDQVCVMSIDSDKPTIIIIRNKEMAKAYQKYFQILWEKTRKQQFSIK